MSHSDPHLVVEVLPIVAASLLRQRSASERRYSEEERARRVALVLDRLHNTPETLSPDELRRARSLEALLERARLREGGSAA